MKNKKYKYILGLVIVILITFMYYVYSINNTDNYKPPYVYTGKTYAFSCNNHNYEVSNDDWIIEYSVTPTTENNTDKHCDDFQGTATLKYQGSSKELLNDISEMTIGIDAGLVGIPSITWKKDDVKFLISSSNVVGINYVNENFTPKDKIALDVELKLTLLDGTRITYYSVITVGPQNILNFKYIKSRYF